ncbi:hypothetical protein [Variovorax sp. PAMC 28711]|uniref:hypothetical protein n=1 Tax=Variovorax sp. PAMC 28711 TaxID=1795631 RepID=UPI001AF01327|nr:hypothetical protein [Variovorax sp. PAMC 28711]
MSVNISRAFAHGQAWRIFQRITHDLSNARLCDCLAQAIRRLEPIGQFLCPFARIAGHATASNVVAANDANVIDDVFPRRSLSFGTGHYGKGNIAIDALPVSLDHELLQRRWNAPPVQGVPNVKLRS